MVEKELRIVAIVGSATPPGRLRRAVEEAGARAAEQSGVAVELIDLADVRVAAADGRPPEQLGDDTAAVLAAIAAADAVVLATPVYRGSADFADGAPTAAAADDLDTLNAALVTLARATGGAPLGGPRPLPERPRS